MSARDRLPRDAPKRLDDVRPEPLPVRRVNASGTSGGGREHDGSERRDVRSRERLVRRVRQEYEEMPGMCLTVAQAHRLFALREDVCVRVLESLVRVGLLDRLRDGQYGLKQTSR